MRRQLVQTGIAAALCFLTLPGVPSARAALAADGYSEQAPRIAELRESRHGGWTAENTFALAWSFNLPSGGSEDDIVAVRYKVVNEHEGRNPVIKLAGPWNFAQDIHLAPPVGGLAPVPGEYEAWVWAEGPDPGPRALAMIRFDDRPPGTATPLLPVDWLRGDAEPVLRIQHPAGAQPVSGIRGYAVAVRPGSPAPPCDGPDQCSLAQTDLRAGIGGDTLSLGRMPEGINVVSVVAVSNSGMRSPRAETAAVKIDSTRPDLQFLGTGDGWSNQPVRVLARAADALSGMAPAGPDGPRTSLSIDGGIPTVAAGDEVAAIVAGSGVHGVLATARDAAGNARGEDGASLPLVDVVRIDEAPPSVLFSRSSDPNEPELIEATVTDALSGPAPRRGAIGVRPVDSGQPFEPLPTTDAGGRMSSRWDSDAYPKGSYEFRATGYDVAGNSTASSLRAGGERMVLVNPVKVPAAIQFGFGGRRLVWHRCVRVGESRRCRREVIESFARRPATRVVPYGRGLQVGGRLVSASGAPLADHPVDLVESFEGDAAARPRTTRVTTDADGLFSAFIADGPNRRIEARFGGTRLLTRTASRELRLGVRTSVRIHASTATAPIGGAPVVFSGHVAHRGAVIPSYGRPLQLQFQLSGTPWTEFRTIQTDAQGRFRFPYSFTDDDSRGVRFLFRAYAPPQPGWPYEPAASRPVAVTGR